MSFISDLDLDFVASATQVRSRIDRGARTHLAMLESAARLAVLQDALRKVDRGIGFDADGNVVEHDQSNLAGNSPARALSGALFLMKYEDGL